MIRVAWTGGVAAVIALLVAFSFVSSGEGDASEGSNAQSFAAMSSSPTGSLSDAISSTTVTQALFEAALERTATCMQDAGVTPIIDYGRGLRPGSVSFEGVSDSDFPATIAVHKQCMSQHLDAIAITWGYQLYTQRQPESVVAIARADCMRANGADPGPTFTADQLQLLFLVDEPSPLMMAWGACKDSLQEQYGTY